MMAETLTDLFYDQLKDAYRTETQLTRALPKMAGAATSAELRAGSEQHLAETQNQLTRLERMCAEVGCKTESHTCKAMQGLIAESEEVIGPGLDPHARDAGLIAAQKVEGYEIAPYDTRYSFVNQLERYGAAQVHHEKPEERRTDEKLTQLVERKVNPKAKT